MYVDSAPHTVANSGLTLAGWKGTFARFVIVSQHCQITPRNSLAIHFHHALHRKIVESRYCYTPDGLI